MIFGLLPIAVACAACIVWAWVVTFREMSQAEVGGWRRTVSLVSVIAATLQAPLPYVIVFCISDPRSRWVGWTEGLAAALFFVALPLSLMRRGAIRWALAFSAAFFFGFTSLMYAVTGLTFRGSGVGGQRSEISSH